MLGSRQQTELAYSVMFSLPGTPVIRYGDEIGMGDNLALKERDAVRTPMHWMNEHQAGFSESDRLIHPVIDSGPYSYKHVNVEDQRREPGSLLNWMTSLIRLRKECPEIGWGQWQIMDTGMPSVLAISYHWKDNSLLVLHNFDEKPHEVILNVKKENAHRLIDLMTNFESEADARGMHCITLDAYGYKWFRGGDLSHLLHRNHSSQ